MSYILDALRRAEADRERERGAVPGLHTPALPGSDASTAPAPRRWLPWAGGGLLLVAGVSAGLWWASTAPDTHPAGGATPQAQAQAEIPAPARPVTAPAPLTAAPVAAPAGHAASEPASASPYLPPAPPPAVAVAVAAAPAPPPARPAPAAQERIPLLSELPEATRRSLPRLSLGGSVYSDDPRSRLVIINGEVLHEGAPIGSDLVLEQIRPRELVLNFRGQRYRQPV